MLISSRAALGRRGLGIQDWCPAPPGDPCGRHRTEAACRADLACIGIPYRGESVVPCITDGAGFASNCPAVGCISPALGSDRPGSVRRAVRDPAAPRP